MNPTVHIPVMPGETLGLLDIRPGGMCVDCTLGGGGHTALMLARGGNVLGIDRDPDALERAREKFASEIREGRLRLAHANHADLAAVASDAGCHEVDAILFDTGFSTDQIEDPARGFSFLHDGPLSMLMNPADAFGAAELLATSSEEELAALFRELGEEPQAKKFARAVCARRQSPEKMTTAWLAALVEGAAGRGCHSKGRHPATRVFQACRMRVNKEVESLASALESGLGLLAPGRGRMAVITFESLTDRLVKQAFLRHSVKSVSLHEGGSRIECVEPAVERLTRRAVTPSDMERESNPRSRSAKLRAVRRLGADETPRIIKP